MSSEPISVEQTFDTLWTYKDKGYLEESVDILRHQGHHPLAVDFALRPDSYYFPKLKDDRLITPDGTRPDKIAAVALAHGQRVSFAKPVLHYIQRTAVVAAGKHSRWVLRDAEREFAEMDEIVDGNGGTEGGASVYSLKADVKDNPDLKVESKPVIVFNRDDPTTRFGAGLLLHELVHVAQVLSEPVRSREPMQCLRREFEATGVQAPLVRSYVEPLDGFNETALAMDEFRLRYLGEGNYQPDEYAMQEFEADGRFARIIANLK